MFYGYDLFVRLNVCGCIFIYNSRALLVSGCMHCLCDNLAWGGLKNGKNGGEPNGFCLIFVVTKNNFGILGNLKERSTFKFSFISGDFLLLIPPFLFTVHIRPVLSPCQAGNTCCILSCFFNYVYKRINIICTHNMYIV